jgi:hypothetical protein
MDKKKISGRVFFACGASITANDISEKTVGHRLVVGTSPHQGHQRPKLDGLEQHCCFRCPSTIKLSGRKLWKRGTFENGVQGSMMTCKVVRIEAEAEPDPEDDADKSRARAGLPSFSGRTDRTGGDL